MIALDEARQQKSLDDGPPPSTRPSHSCDALRRAYDAPKPHEKELLRRVLYTRFRVLADKGQIDQAHRRAQGSVRRWASMASPGSTLDDVDGRTADYAAIPGRAQGRRTTSDCAEARERTQGLLGPPSDVPFNFTLPDLDGKKVSLARLQGKGRGRGLLGHLVRSVPRGDPLARSRSTTGGIPTGWKSSGSVMKRTPRANRNTREMVKKFVQAAKIPYTCLLGDRNDLKQVPGFKGFPTTVVVDRAGKVRLLVIEESRANDGLDQRRRPRLARRAGAQERRHSQGLAAPAQESDAPPQERHAHQG